jgi:hypothetical protein
MLYIFGVEDGGQHVLGALPQPGELLGVHPRHPRRRVEEPVPLRVLADGEQDLADRPLDALLIDGRLLVSRRLVYRELPSRLFG